MESLPVANVAVNIMGIPTQDGIIFHSQVTNGGSNIAYQWTKNDLPIPGAVYDSLFIKDLTMTDEVKLIVDHNLRCANSDLVPSNMLTKMKVTGVEDDINVVNEFTLYPSPNRGRFTVAGAFIPKEIVVEVLNAVGQIVYRTHILPNQNDFKIDMGDVPQGNLSITV